MSVATRPLTSDDLLQTPEGDGIRYELLGGELFVSASPAKRHTWILARLARLLGNHVEQRGLGEVFGSPIDVRLTKFDVVVPDIVFIRSERFHLFGEHFLDGAPDLIVEILSPSTRVRDRTDKLRLYARFGVPEYWIVDPESSGITVFVLSRPGSYEALDTSAGFRSTVLPDFELSPPTLFAGID